MTATLIRTAEDVVPSMGDMKAALTGMDPARASEIDAGYYRAVRGDLY
ncbi:hypothetical protein [Pandoraea oxalativorans]|nr:hypothetical protein [Pandoraea oxalativorans]